MQIKMVNDSEFITWDFSYDSKGKLTSINHAKKYDGKIKRNITNYFWDNNTIIAEDGGSTRTYTINEGLVRIIRDSDKRHKDWSNATFNYNSSDQLIAVQDNNWSKNSIETYTWDNERIINSTYTDDTYYRLNEHIDEYTYSGKTCKGYFPLYSPSDHDYIFYAHPELIGLRCSQQPDKVYSKDGYNEETKQYTYTLDKNGYIESCTEASTNKILNINETITKTTIYTFTWE